MSVFGSRDSIPFGMVVVSMAMIMEKKQAQYVECKPNTAHD